MQFTPQQMAGYKGYSTGVLIGNWSEDLQVLEDKMQKYQSSGAHGAGGGGGGKNGTIGGGGRPKRVMLSPKHDDGNLHFGDVVMLQSAATEGYLSIDIAPRSRPKLNHSLISASQGQMPSVRNTWVIRRSVDANNKFYESEGEGDVVHYGQFIKIVNEYASDDGDYSLASCPLTASAQSKISGRQEVTACLGGTTDCFFFLEQADGKQASVPKDGQPVPSDATFVIRHKGTRSPLYTDKKSMLMSSHGGEFEVSALLAKTQANRVSVPVLTENFWNIKVGPKGGNFVPYNSNADRDVMSRVRAKILERGGSQGFRGLVKSLRIMDDDGNRTLSRRELKEGLDVYGIPLSTSELDAVFKEFDTNGDCTISISEFLRTIRGSMNLRRTDIVRKAFRSLDHDGSGVATMDELRSIYAGNLKEHPAVKAGTKTENEVLRDFNAGWDKDHDGAITVKEFEEYYSDISVSIDDDDYFELMIRNAWHISGGEGWCENTANRRVLVVYNNDKQEVVELTNDLGIDGDDMQAILAKLKQQGIADIKRVELTF